MRCQKHMYLCSYLLAGVSSSFLLWATYLMPLLQVNEI